MIKIRINNEYKDVVKIFSGGTLQKEIIKVWSGEAHEYVYESSVEYTGTLPVTISANGDALLDYRIYGASGGVGEPTENLYNKNDPDIVYSAYMNYAGNIIQGSYGNEVKVSGYIPINGGQTYTGTNLMDSGSGNYYAYYDTNKQLLETGLVANNKVFNSPINAAYIRTTLIHRNSEDIATLVEGSTAPTEYIPYGYKLPMIVHSELKDIGDTVSVNGDLWDIVNYNNDFTRATLLRHETMPGIMYNAKQAIFAFPNGLAAGNYHFTIAQSTWVPQDVGKTLTFTLAQAIPEGGQLVLNGSYNRTLVNTTISSYADPTSTTAIETVTMTEGDSGTDLGSLTNAGTPASNINSIQKALLGSNEWKTSAMRQYLNSDEAAGSVWIPQTIFDRPPTWAANAAGFMVWLDEDFLSCVADTTYVTVRNVTSDGGGTDTLTDKFYLPSRTEVFGSNEVENTPEGTLYQYYVNATNDDRIKHRENARKSWQLRTPHVSFPGYTRYVYTTGAMSYSDAYSVKDYSPACQIDLTKLSNSWLQNNMYKVRATTTPVYIGENKLDSVEGVADYVDKASGKIVRMIGEYTFTGDEAFTTHNNYGVCYTTNNISPRAKTPNGTITMRCDHPTFTAIVNHWLGDWTSASPENDVCDFRTDSSVVVFRSTANFMTSEECKTYLKSQYDNGTPVKISYWLNTPIEEDPPVPLPEIPTIKGETVIDYDGDPKPSQMYIKYRR